MTRETKISLLIGLAFIIVIGMLLADYSSNSNQPPRVPLLDLKETVLDSTATPSRASNQGNLNVNGVEPNRQVVIAGDNPDRTRQAIVRFPAPERRAVRTPGDESRNPAPPTEDRRTPTGRSEEARDRNSPCR